jgi:hypothetical protein
LLHHRRLVIQASFSEQLLSAAIMAAGGSGRAPTVITTHHIDIMVSAAGTGNRAIAGPAFVSALRADDQYLLIGVKQT